MRLRLFDRLQSLLRRNAGPPDAGPGRIARPRGGGHRKRVGVLRRLSSTPAASRSYPDSRGYQAPAGALPPRSAQPPWVTQPPVGVGYPPAMQPPAGIRPWAGGGPASNAPASNGPAGGGGGGGRARIREAPYGSAPITAAEAPPRQPWYRVIGPPPASQPPGSPPALTHELTITPGRANQAALAKSAPNPAAQANAAAQAAQAARDPGQAKLPFTPPHPEGFPALALDDGRANCGPLEKILWRQWEEGATPHPQAVAAVERLASLPRALQEKLAAGLTAIYVGSGGVPELDHMTELRGVRLPSGKATWDACAGAYGERKIVVGTRPSPTPDVMCHEVGHALDDLDSPPGRWQSDSAEFRLIYDQCRPYLASDFHGQRGGLGRKEFFADSFAAIASGQRPALVDMLNGNTRVALRVMLYFNRRYGI
jgi:hypothetical protein